ncbi:MAG: SDR family NAD(P)-dependent oxidoreductase [Patulibacter minatonensis]
MASHEQRSGAEADPRPVWLITGAGRGLGRAFATEALEQGARVVGLIRTAGALGDLATAHPGRLLEVIADVRDQGDVQAAVMEAAEAFGRLDVVVNNAGYGLVGAIEEVSEAEIRAQLETNLLGAIWTTQAALPHLRANGGGDIVQISTVGAIGSMPTFGIYNASKWGLEGFSEALAAEVRPFGIGVTIAELGGFATDWSGASLQFATGEPQYDELRVALFGTAQVPWPVPDGESASADAPPAGAAAALWAHLARPREQRPLRVLIGDDAPTQAAAALEARRDSYDDPRLAWPAARS